MKTPKLDPFQHLLVILGEEGAEIAQACAKTLRFGPLDRNVLNPTGPTNQERLVEELNDLMGVINRCVEVGIIPVNWMDPEKIASKEAKILKFMRYAAEVGALQGPAIAGHWWKAE